MKLPNGVRAIGPESQKRTDSQRQGLADTRGDTFSGMLPRTLKLISSRRVLEGAFICAAALATASCGNSLGPAVAVTLNLYSVDGVVIPVPLKSSGGKSITIGNGRLQGTNWGHACGMSLQLAEGPITAVDVADCKLIAGEEKRFTATLFDSRFPSGAHEYRFVP